MSASSTPRILSFKSDTASIARGSVVKPGSDDKHVAKSALATSKNFGIAQNVVSAVEDTVEVAIQGGGAKGLLGGTVAFGDFLTSNASGALVATTTGGDRVVAVAMQDGVSGDLIAVEVVNFNV